MSIVEESRRRAYVPETSLLGREYTDPDVYVRERLRIFRREWVAVGRDEAIPAAGDVLAQDVGGESVLVIRQRDGGLRAFFNSCRHRGTRLLEDSCHVGNAIKCPYHAWAYAIDGRLIATPNVPLDEVFDREDFPLWRVEVDSWGGFIFVNTSDTVTPLPDRLAGDPEEPLQFDRWRMDDLRIGSEISFDVAANWKIIVDNYNECLHCPSVHPELSALVPTFKRGEVEERADSWAVDLVEGATSFTMTGRSSLPPLPGVEGEDLHRYYGCYLLPNLMLNFTSDAVRYFILLPRAVDRTTVVLGHLFARATVEQPDFDPSEVVEFGALIARQDWRVCELAQRGVSSAPFAKQGGVYPYQDRLLADFKKRYRALMAGETEEGGRGGEPTGSPASARP